MSQDERANASKKRLRPRHWVLLVLLLIGAAVFALPYAFSGWVVSELRARGLGGDSLAARFRTPSEFTIENLAVGTPPFLRAKRVSVSFSPASLFRRRVEAIRVEGLEVDLAYAGSTPWPAELNELFEEAGGQSIGAPSPTRASPSGPRTLPFETLELDASRIDFATPVGRFRASLALHLNQDGRGDFHLDSPGANGEGAIAQRQLAPFSMKGTLDLNDPEPTVVLEPFVLTLTESGSGDAQQATLRTPQIRVHSTSRAGQAIRVVGSGGALGIEPAGAKLDDFQVDLGWEAGQAFPAGDITVARVLKTGRDPLFTPFGLKMRLTPKGRGLGIAAQVRWTSPSAEANLHVTLPEDESPVRFRLAPLQLEGALKDPALLLPSLTGIVTGLAGSLEAEGEFDWSSSSPGVEVITNLRGISASLPSVELNCVSGDIVLRGPDPWTTARGQTLTMASLEVGLPLTKGKIEFQLDSGELLEILNARWDFAGGSISTRGRIALLSDHQELSLNAAGLDLAKLFQLLQIEGLAGAGQLDGRLPLVRRGPKLEIRHGVLTARGPHGWIRYRPVAGQGYLAQTGSVDLADLEQALRNFHYTKLTLRVNGDISEKLRVEISLAGANPEYRDAQPYVFNLNVDGRLGALVSQGGAIYDLPQRIEDEVVGKVTGNATRGGGTASRDCPPLSAEPARQ